MINTLSCIYYSLIYLQLTCGCALWGNNYDAPLSKVVKLRNKVVCIINNVPLMEPIAPCYTALGLLKVPDLIILNTSLLLYDYFNADKNSNLNFLLLSKLHDYNTQSVP